MPLLPTSFRGACTFLLVAATISLTNVARSQGCVAIKQMDGSTVCSLDGHELSGPTKWDFSVSYEHFRSHRHFVGTEQQFQRYAAGSEVINEVDQIDTSLSYKLDGQTSVSLGIPYFSASRSSLYEHDRVNRYTTHGRGIGDMRVSVSHWLRGPTSPASNNLSFAIGLKMPTGDSNYKDDFHTTAGLRNHNVDQSIQPGDGAWGYIVGLQAYQKLTSAMSLYASGFYLINPKETNGTRTTSSITSVTAYNSVADEFQARTGINYLLERKHAITGSLGLLTEGVPSSDLFGGDAGFRRPGYVISVEPGISYSPIPNDLFSLSVPYAIKRNRVRSYADKLSGGHGDAAFADFLINVAYSHKW